MKLQRSHRKNIITDTLWYLKQMSKLNFLSSLRFWALCLIALGGVLQTEGVISQEVFTALATILGGFTVIRTVDKFSQK